MYFERKSRFRLWLECYVGMAALLTGLVLYSVGRSAVGLVIAVPACVYVFSAGQALRASKEVLTRRQKKTLFAVEATTDIGIILGLLWLALTRQTDLHWKVFAFGTLAMLVAMAISYRRSYTDPVGSPKDANEPPA
jgi:hypothetical protein